MIRLFELGQLKTMFFLVIIYLIGYLQLILVFDRINHIPLHNVVFWNALEYERN